MKRFIAVTVSIVTFALIAIGALVCLSTEARPGAPAAAQPVSPVMQEGKVTVTLRLTDSSTGYGVQPSEILVSAQDTGSLVYRLSDSTSSFIPLRRTDIRSFNLPAGSYKFTVTAAGYAEMGGAVTVVAGSPQTIELNLVSTTASQELTAEYLGSVNRGDSTAIYGFVVDDATGLPLEGVKVGPVGGKEEGTTDIRGYFLIRIAALIDYAQATADLLFEKGGYQSVELRNIRNQPGSGWFYKIKLSPGSGRRFIEESKPRTYNRDDSSGKQEAAGRQAPPTTLLGSVERPEESGSVIIEGTSVNVPKTIRVGFGCNDTRTCTSWNWYDLEEYTKHALSAEWYYDCWGSLAGGIESLKAGAVAVRSYASTFVRQPLSSNYDICTGTACQAWSEGVGTYMGLAVTATSSVVLITLNNQVASSEYSAENNNYCPGGT